MDISLPTFYLLSRITTAFFSTAVVYLTYCIGKKLYNRTVGLIAGLILSFTFLDVLVSHYIKHDVYAQFFGILAFFFCCFIYHTGKLRYYLLSGLFIGIAIAIKLSALFFVVPLVVAHFLFILTVARRKTPVFVPEYELLAHRIRAFFHRNIFYGLLAILLGLIISKPQYLMGLTTFKTLKDISVLLAQRDPSQVLASDENGIPNVYWWLIYLVTSGFFYPFFVLSLGGIIWGIRKHTKTEILLFSFPVIYYFILSIQPTRYDRWAANLTPFFALFAALFLYRVYRFWRYRLNLKKGLKVTLILLLFVLTIGVSAVRVCLFDYSIARKDTRQQAAEWLVSHYPKDQLIFAIDDTINIGHYLQKEGFGNLMHLFPFDTKEIFLYHGEVLLIDSVNYHIAENYKNIEGYKEFWENYQLVKKKGELVKEFSQPFFKAEFFSPAFLEISSTVNAYHNPTVEVYKIPKLDEYATEEISYEYRPEKMDHNMQLIEKNNHKFLFKESKKQGIIVGPHELFPKGGYLLEYLIINPDCYYDEAIIILRVNPSGQAQPIAETKFSCKSLSGYNKLNLQFRLEKPTRLELVLEAREGVSFFVEKAVLKRTNYD